MLPATWLVDYYNLTIAGSSRGQRHLGWHQATIETLCDLAAAWARENAIGSVGIRLYGGWFDSAEGNPTDDLGLVSRIARDMPRLQKRVRLRLQVATSLLAQADADLYWTRRRVEGSNSGAHVDTSS
ncbi:MAG: hypothetical protein MUE69_20025, partial [Myxococcota bacterium]|nr:hypothetical protein [Myxococcota bacterium]